MSAPADLPLWQDELSCLRGCGSERQEQLARLGLFTIGDVLRHYPRRYEDRSATDFPEGPSEQAVTAEGVITDLPPLKRFGGKTVAEVVIEELGAWRRQVVLRWWNMPYRRRHLVVGQRVVAHGRVKQIGRQLIMNFPELEVDEEGLEALHTRRIVPVHSVTEGLSPRVLRGLVWAALDHAQDDLPPLRWPNAPRTGAEFYQNIHFPESFEELEHVRELGRLDELLVTQIILLRRRQQRAKLERPLREAEGQLCQQLLLGLPFQPTEAQLRVINEIREDLKKPHPMLRLLHGEVGSGKTLVAFAAMLQVVESGWQAALMAPTQVVAEQHYQQFSRWAEPMGLRVGLRTSEKKTEADLPLFSGRASSEHPDILVGTHALLYESAMPKLGLAVIDEQHKFGVAHRARLAEKGQGVDVLVMSATPIPRTLAMHLYGDLRVSVLDQLPTGRQPVHTQVQSVKLVRDLKPITEKILGCVERDERVYLVFPLIDPSEKIDAKAATTEWERWSKLLKPHPVGLLHGRMRREEKENAIEEFRSGKTPVLASTTVVEVGVDVAEATLMVIFDADRFGLAQLHQLRGRVGRSHLPSQCLLVPGKKFVDHPDHPLRILEATHDGFRIAEEDYRLRGSGEVLGTSQSGAGELLGGHLDLRKDGPLVEKARDAAEKILREDPGLSKPTHQPLNDAVAKTEENIARQLGHLHIDTTTAG